MNSNMKKIAIQLFICFVFLLSISNISYANKMDKTIIIVTDQLDFSTIEKLELKREMSLGLMNTRTSNVFNKSDESFFMTIAAGRRVELEKGLFKGIKVNNKGNLVIEGYKDIKNTLDEKYKNFSQEIEFLGDTLKKHGVNTSYMGNDVSSLLAADKSGVIDNGYPSIEYNIEWLSEKTNELLKKTDVLVLSYHIENDENKISILEEYINKFSQYNMMIFPSKVSGDLDDIRNSTLVPILYQRANHTSGLLTSQSTNRDGLITNMDIFPELVSIYNIELITDTGHEIYSVGEHLNKRELIDINRSNLDKTLNFIVIKYIFHGLIAIIQIYIIYDILRRKNCYYDRYNTFMKGIIVAIFVSLLLGIFKFGNSIIIYCLVLMLLTVPITLFINRRKENSIVFFPICTNILLLLGVFFKPDIIYYSFFGFNNIITGGRFYGLNNESMAILLTTSIITYFWLREKINNKLISLLLLFIYFPVNILALSGNYASNFGGFITSLALFAMLLYTTIFNNRFDKKNIFVLVAIGITIFILTFMIDINSSSNGHAESFFSRVSILGIYEFFDMIIKKVKQLVLIAISPPWSIALIGQVYFISKFRMNEKEVIEKAKEKNPDLIAQLLIIFISSIIAFLINDTGAVAFVYMNTFVIAKLISIRASYQ